MGSCISKCRPKKKFKEEDQTTHVHDKLVISQHPPIPTIPLEIPLFPPPSTPSFSSFSSSSSKTASSISSSSSSSCSSSVLSANNRSFSNEFLWSCAKENPHIVVGQDHRKTVLSANKILSPNLDQSPFPPPKLKHSVHEKAAIGAATPKKRARAGSPTLVRQKSFRREQNSVTTSARERGLRSPSPSRRFGGESNNRSFSTTYEHCYNKRPVVAKGINAAGSGMRRESFRASPNRGSTSDRSGSVRKKEGVSEHISTKMDAIKSGMEMEVVMEDIDNPLIALDCFIFL